jgi:hypothetical protein
MQLDVECMHRHHVQGMRWLDPAKELELELHAILSNAVHRADIRESIA